MHKRDLALLVACAIFVLISMGGQSGWKMTPVQFFDIDTSLYANRHFASEGERSPKPIITDLNGDGENEILFATREPKLYLTKPRESSDGAPSRLPIIAEASLLSAVRVVSGRQPVAMAVGYLDSHEEKKKREQVIVVVTHGWSILLFDKNLQIVWETNLSDDLPAGFFHKETAIHISPFRLNPTDRGSVIVGGRMDYKKSDDYEWHSNRATNPTNSSKLFQDEMEDSSFDDEERHFSYFAFDGKTGKLRWKHEAGDFHQALFDDGMLYPQHNYKLHVKSNLKHIGEVDWRNYRENILQALPYRWSKREDTEFYLAHFSRKPKAAEKCKPDPYKYLEVPVLKPEDGAKKVGLPPQAMHDMGVTEAKPKQTEPSSRTPNVLVAVIQEGIEVIHMSSGRTLCQMRLSPTGAWADVNGDGVPEHVEGLIESHDAAGFNQLRKSGFSCNAVVTSGVPKSHHVFNGTICQSQGLRALFFGSKTTSPLIETVSPLVIRRYDFRRSLSHLPIMDSVFYVSNGCVTSYSGEGHLNWMSCDCPTYAVSHKSDTQESNFLDASLMPQLESFKLLTRTSIEHILVVGERQLTLLDPANGEQLVKVDLHEGPVAPVVIGDLNGDGHNDLIVPTRQAYKVFYLERTPASLLQRLLVGLVVLCIGGHLLVKLTQESAQNPRLARLRRKLYVD
eukprot:TRINITY_DN1652_c0_g2_i7.p1 TRINITY_DN1652_c0_g2~~TRINITY_DN1652_c0_g2_i7.p1  ORF type:complete len:678 (+),score=112.13 TRINITY_DN1652_c0_g2_i7:42-2075(+)